MNQKLREIGNNFGKLPASEVFEAPYVFSNRYVGSVAPKTRNKFLALGETVETPVIGTVTS